MGLLDPLFIVLASLKIWSIECSALLIRSTVTLFDIPTFLRFLKILWLLSMFANENIIQTINPIGIVVKMKLKL